MFRGASKVTLDEKGRMVLPTRQRQRALDDEREADHRSENQHEVDGVFHLSDGIDACPAAELKAES